MAVDCSVGRVLLLEQRVENLRGLLEEIEGWICDAPDAYPPEEGSGYAVVPGGLWFSIRQALHREEG